MRAATQVDAGWALFFTDHNSQKLTILKGKFSMKSLRNLFAALTLTCMLSVSSFAGDMGTQGIATSETGTSMTATAAGDMGTPITSSTDPVTGIALSLLQSVLALF